MKKKLSKLFFLLLFLQIHTNLKAQFIPAAATEYSHATNIGGLNTGNDFWGYQNGDSYGVTSYDSPSNSNSGLAWDVILSGTPYHSQVDFKNKADHTDVALAAGRKNIYAIVVYHLAGLYYWDVHYWNGSAFVSVAGPSSFATATTTVESLHISSDEASNFLITWSDNNYVYAMSGSPGGSGFPTFNNSGIPVQLGKGSYPDNSLTYDPTTSPNYFAEVSYVSFVPDISVDEFLFSTLAGGLNTVNNNVSLTPFHGGTPSLPRIASKSNINYNEWTVVFEEQAGGREYIDVHENWSGNSFTYNDGTATGAPSQDLTNVPNREPNVSYAGDYLFVGWMMNNQSGTISGAATARYGILLRCYNDATVAVTSYWEVPTSLSASNTSFYSPALAGRDSWNELYASYYDKVNSIVLTKKVIASGSSMKLASVIPSDKSLKDLSMDNPLVNIRIYDLTGRIIQERKGLFNDVFNEFSVEKINLPSSVYIARINSDDGQYHLSQKILIE